MLCHDEVSEVSQENLLRGDEKVELEIGKIDTSSSQNVNEGEEEAKIESTMKMSSSSTSDSSSSASKVADISCNQHVDDVAGEEEEETVNSPKIVNDDKTKPIVREDFPKGKEVYASAAISEETATAKHCETVTAVQEDTQENEVATISTTDDNNVVDSKVEELNETKEMKCCDEDNAPFGTLESTTRSQTGISKDEEEAKGNETMIDSSADTKGNTKAEEALGNDMKGSSCKDKTSSNEEMENKTIIDPKDDDVTTTTATAAAIKDTITTTQTVVDDNSKAEELDCMKVDEEEAKEVSEETGKVGDCCINKDATVQDIEVDDEKSIATGQDDSSTAGAVEAIDKLDMNGEEGTNGTDEVPQGIANISNNKATDVVKSQEVQEGNEVTNNSEAAAIVNGASDKMMMNIEDKECVEEKMKVDVVNTESSNKSEEEKAEDDSSQTNNQSQIDEAANVENSMNIVSPKSSGAVDKEGMTDETLKSSMNTTSGVPESVTDIDQKAEDNRDETSTPNMSPVPDTVSKEKECNIDSSPTKKKAGFLRRLKQKLSKPKNSSQ